MYALRTGRLVGSERIDSSWQDLTFSPDGRLLAAVGLGGEIVLWNVRRRALERSLRHSAAVVTVRFSPDGKTIATGDLAGNVDLWDPFSGRKVGRTLGGHNGLVLSVSFDPSGTQLATMSGDGNVRLWDLASRKLVGEPLPGADGGGWGPSSPTESA